MSSALLEAAAREQRVAVAESRARRRADQARERADRAAARATSLRGLVDLGVLAVLCGVLMLGLVPAWGGVLPLLGGFGGLALGIGLAWATTVRRVGLLGTTAWTLVAHVLLGGAVALPSTTIAGLVPTMQTLRGLLLGPATVWMDALTAAPPLGLFPELGLLPYLLGLLAGVVAGRLALRTVRGTWALLPVVVLGVAVVLVSTARPFAPVLLGLVTLVGGMLWAVWRTGPGAVVHAEGGEESAEAALHRDPGADPAVLAAQAAASRARRLRGGSVMVGAAVLVTALLAPTLAPGGPRVVLREHIVPPLEIEDVDSPLAAFRSYAKDRADEVVLTVDGLPAGERIRLAVLDRYDGTVMDVAGSGWGEHPASGTFQRVGETFPPLPQLAGASAPTGAPTTVTVMVGDYADVWVPIAGDPTSVTFSGAHADDVRRGLHVNPVTRTVLSTHALEPGDTYTFTTRLPTVPSGTVLEQAGFAELDLPAPAAVPDSVVTRAEGFVGAEASPLLLAQGLRDGLAAVSVLSHGREGDPASRAGHGADRIATLLDTETIIGDDEQLAVAMALMARQRGVPARVVLGLYDAEAADAAEEVQADASAGGAVAGGSATATGPRELRGDDVHAWVEVAFAGVGWVPFDPLPDDDVPPQNAEARGQSEPQPQQLLQPPPPEEPEEPAAQPLPEDGEEEELAPEEQGAWGDLLMLLVPLGVLLLLLSPFLAIVLAKRRRRTRRRSHGTGVDRVVGGWSEVVDAALDLGQPLERGRTRRQDAHALESVFASAGVLTLARSTDVAVFGPGEPAPADVDGLWAQVDEVLGGMTRSVGPWARLRARVSLRSLRSSGHPARSTRTRAVRTAEKDEER